MKQRIAFVVVFGSLWAALFALAALIARGQDAGLDLPIEPPVFGKKLPELPTTIPGGAPTRPRPVAPPEQPVPPVDDPRDTPPPVLFGEEIDGSGDSIFYVIDVSGSMGQWAQVVIRGGSLYQRPSDGQWVTFEDVGVPTRLEAAKVELCRSIQSLPDNFMFNMLAYDCTVRTWQQFMQPVTPETRAAAAAWVGHLYPGGDTGTGPAVAQALLMEPNNMHVVVLTDGNPTCPGSDMAGYHRNMIRSTNRQGARIDVFGIAPEDSIFRTFCQNVAADAGGAYYDVPLN